MSEDEQLLVIFMEECGELIKELSKVVRFGRYEKLSPETPCNHLRAQNELNDVITMAWRCGFDFRLNEEHRDKKMKAIDKYMAYSRELGIVK